MIDVAKARKAAQRLVDVAFRNRDKVTGEPILPVFSIPADEERDDDLVVMAALDALDALQQAVPRTSDAKECWQGCHHFGLPCPNEASTERIPMTMNGLQPGDKGYAEAVEAILGPAATPEVMKERFAAARRKKEEMLRRATLAAHNPEAAVAEQPTAEEMTCTCYDCWAAAQTNRPPAHGAQRTSQATLQHECQAAIAAAADCSYVAALQRCIGICELVITHGKGEAREVVDDIRKLIATLPEGEEP